MGKRGRKEEENPGQADPEAEEKKRLRSLAFSRRVLRRAPANPAAPLGPAKSVARLDGHDIVKRGQRRSRYLFSFPGLLAPLSAGRIGELADLATKNPLLYLEFPQGRMKLFGTHVYPKNKYLSLQLTKSSKGVMCEDSFDSMIVFSDAWWIGIKEENPEELQLDIPKDITEGKPAEADFKGGAGATSEGASSFNKPRNEYIEPRSPDIELIDDTHKGSVRTTTKQDTKNATEITPVRQSARTTKKMLTYAESSGEDSIGSDAEVPEMLDEKVDTRSDNTTRRSLFGKIEDSDAATSSLAGFKSEIIESKVCATGKIEESSLSSKKPKANSSKKGTLVQSTLSTLFEKVTERKSKRSAAHSPEPKVSGGKRQRVNPKHIIDQVQVKGSNKKVVPSVTRKGTGIKKHSQVEDGRPEEISSDTQVEDGTPEEISSDSQVEEDDDASEEISSESQDDSDEDWDADV